MKIQSGAVNSQCGSCGKNLWKETCHLIPDPEDKDFFSKMIDWDTDVHLCNICFGKRTRKVSKRAEDKTIDIFVQKQIEETTDINHLQEIYSYLPKKVQVSMKDEFTRRKKYLATKQED